jgi:hypothetical protein
LVSKSFALRDDQPLKKRLGLCAASLVMQPKKRVNKTNKSSSVGGGAHHLHQWHERPHNAPKMLAHFHCMAAES